ncbi:hypothetical protein D3C83_286860 [compost metagenome]
MSTAFTAQQVRDRLKPALDPSDKLIVVDASNNAASWANLGAEAIARLKAQGFE